MEPKCDIKHHNPYKHRFHHKQVLFSISQITWFTKLKKICKTINYKKCPKRRQKLNVTQTTILLIISIPHTNLIGVDLSINVCLTASETGIQLNTRLQSNRPTCMSLCLLNLNCNVSSRMDSMTGVTTWRLSSAIRERMGSSQPVKYYHEQVETIYYNFKT